MKSLQPLWIFLVPWLLLSADEAARQTVAADNTTFGVNLCRTIDQMDPGKGFCISPFSIGSALVIPYLGAEGRTAIEFSETLNYLLPDTALTTAYAELEKFLTHHLSNYPAHFRFVLANSVWVQMPSMLLPGYENLIRNKLQASIFQVDFIRQPEESRVRINQWVHQATMGKIPQLLDRSALKADARMVSVSALYLKGKWQNPFLEEHTHPEPFFPSKGTTLSLPFMHQTAVFGYYEDREVSALELDLEPLTGKAPQFSMVVVLPAKDNGNNPQLFTSELFERVLNGLRSNRVTVALPKFEARSQLNLVDTLKKMGMTTPFSEAADFSGITDQQKLLISDIVHETFLDIREGGLEAAAATAAVLSLTSLPPGNIKNFKADRPFIYLIREKTSGVTLFIGRFES